MKNIWRFYDGQVSGIVIASDCVQARDRAIEYLNGYFAEDDPVSEEDVEVWRAEMDDDFNESFPYALSVSY